MRIRTKVIWASLFMLAVPPVSCVKVFCDLVGGEVCEDQTQAAEQQIEIGVGQSYVDSVGSDDDADTATVRYFGAILNHLGGGVAIERLEHDDQGAYCLDALLRGHYTHKLVTFYAQGGIGVAVSDIEERTEEITVTATAETEEDGHGNHHGSSSVTATASAEVETEDQQVGFRGSAAVGVQFHFSNALRNGFGVEFGYALPLGDGFAVEEEKQLRAYYILPIGGY